MKKNIKAYVTENPKQKNSYEVNVDGESFHIQVLNKKKKKEKKDSKRKIEPPKTHTKSHINAPISGTIKELKKNIGDRVKAGQTVAILEAMKMYNNIDAHREGRIKEIKIKEGDLVAKNDILMIIE
mgnify:CR=1 FL=1